MIRFSCLWVLLALFVGCESKPAPKPPAPDKSFDQPAPKDKDKGVPFG